MNRTSRILDEGFIRNRGDGLRLVASSGNETGRLWTEGLSLQLNKLALSLGILQSSSVFLDTTEEICSALGVLNVFNTDIDTLFHITVSDLLVEDDTDGGLGDVVDDTSLALVVLVRHTLLDGTVDIDVDDITNTVGDHVSGELGWTMFSELAREKVSSSGSETE